MVPFLNKVGTDVACVGVSVIMGSNMGWTTDLVRIMTWTLAWHSFVT